jgi:hypothetical protein
VRPRRESSLIMQPLYFTWLDSVRELVSRLTPGGSLRRTEVPAPSGVGGFALSVITAEGSS